MKRLLIIFASILASLGVSTGTADAYLLDCHGHHGSQWAYTQCDNGTGSQRAKATWKRPLPNGSWGYTVTYGPWVGVDQSSWTYAPSGYSYAGVTWQRS